MAEKRDRVFSSPTGRTPRQGTKRRVLREAGQSAVQHEPRELDLSASGASVRPGSSLAAAPSAATQQPSCWSEETVQHTWRKVCREITKRQDPHLPFFYHTSSLDRFYEGERGSFNLPAVGESKKDRHMKHPQRAELLSSMVAGRATLPTVPSHSIRMTFHSLPIDMPPAPGTHSRSADRTYHL